MERNLKVPGLKEAITQAVSLSSWDTLRTILEEALPSDSTEYKQLMEIKVINKNANIVVESCSCGYTELVQVFLNHGLSPNCTVDNYSKTMLHWAAYGGHLALVELLLDVSVNIDCRNNSDFHTPAILAVEQGHLDVVKLLIGASDYIHTNVEYSTFLLSRAVLSESNSSAEVVQFLLDSGCDPNSRYPVLNIAVHLNINVKIIQLLLEAGAHVNQKLGEYTPLHAAANNCNNPIMQLLLKYGADINLRGKAGNTALHEAVSDTAFHVPFQYQSPRNKVESVKFLIDHGSLIDTVNYNQETPLLLSIKLKAFDVAIELLNSGAVIDLDVYPELLYESLMEGAPVQFIECLLEHGASVTTFHTAALQCVIFCSNRSNDWKLPMTKLLLIYGFNHYVTDIINGNTVLHLACEMGDVELVKYLLDYGLNVDAKNKYGQKPYDIATEEGHTNIVKEIILYQCNRYTSFN